MGFGWFLTAFDPKALPGSSGDALRSHRSCIYLANKTLPDLTTAASRRRYVSMLCAALVLGGDERQSRQVTVAHERDAMLRLGEDSPFALKSIGNGRYTFQSRLADGNIETNAFRLDANRLHARDLAGLMQSLEAAVTLDGSTRFWRLSSASLAALFAVRDQLRGNHQFNVADAVIWGDDWDALVDEHEDIASHAPALKKAATIERKLVYAPIEQRLHTLLERQVLRIKKKLSDCRRAQADTFDAAAESVLASWTVSDPTKGEPATKPNDQQA